MSDWPKVGDSLFGAGAWRAEALLGVSVDWFYEYAAAYKEAADALVEAVEADRLVPDSVGYPILFLYRHYVELALKGIIKAGTNLEQSIANSPEHHRIEDLWQRARPLLERAFPECEKAVTDVVESCIKELASIDPSGEACRYGKRPEKRGGGPTWPDSVQLNLANVREVMGGIAVFLDGSYEGMSELLQHQADMDSDYSE